MEANVIQVSFKSCQIKECVENKHSEFFPRIKIDNIVKQARKKKYLNHLANLEALLLISWSLKITDRKLGDQLIKLT